MWLAGQITSYVAELVGLQELAHKDLIVGV